MSVRFLAASLFVFAVSAAAQSGAGQGSISGIVVDASGGAVAGAAVTVANESKGIRRALETTNDGLFNAPALVPADGYKVSVTKPGFATYEATGITVTVGQNVGLRVAMSVAATTTTVDVSAQAA